VETTHGIVDHHLMKKRENSELLAYLIQANSRASSFLN